MKRNSLLFLAIIGLCIVRPLAVSADAKGIVVSPFEQNITMQPTDTEKVFDVTVTNNSPTVQDLSLQALDFGSLNETGGLVLEGSDSKYSQKYGLASWMTLGVDTVVLGVGESRAIPVTITNRQSLQPGGHYGAVVVKVNSLDDQSGNKVVINQQLLSLVFVDKVGGEKYDLKLVGMKHNGNWFTLPSKVTLRFQNPGNVHVLPRGIVELQSPNGKVLATGMINTESAFVLPESFRTMQVPLQSVGTAAPLPGLYKIVVKYRYDGVSNYAVKKYYVNFISAGMYVLGFLVLIGLFFGIRFYRSKKHTK